MSYEFIYLANRIKLLDRLEQQIKLNIILNCGISMITHTIEIGQKLREKRSDSFGNCSCILVWSIFIWDGGMIILIEWKKN